MDIRRPHQVRRVEELQPKSNLLNASPEASKSMDPSGQEPLNREPPAETLVSQYVQRLSIVIPSAN